VDIFVHGDAGFEMKALEYATKLVGQGYRCESSVFETREQAKDYAKIRGIKRIDYISNTVETIQID
jgi:ATP phosphoribosyltransferase regulatory subunit